MFDSIRRIARDDIAVKLLFDHVRNIGICAVVFGAAFWKYKNIGTGYVYILDAAIIGLLVVLGLFLFVVNQWHGYAKLQAAQPPRWFLQVIMQIYSLIAVTIAFAVVGVKL